LRAKFWKLKNFTTLTIHIGFLITFECLIYENHTRLEHPIIYDKYINLLGNYCFESVSEHYIDFRADRLLIVKPLGRKALWPVKRFSYVRFSYVRACVRTYVLPPNRLIFFLGSKAKVVWNLTGHNIFKEKLNKIL
jgi:hypothetical protein